MSEAVNCDLTRVIKEAADKVENVNAYKRRIFKTKIRRGGICKLKFKR